MPQITEAERKRRIAQLLRELRKQPPEKVETMRVPWTANDPLLCEVIKIGVDEVLLNHRSHRIRAQLEDDPEWRDVENDPHSEAAQRIVERHVRDSRSAEDFKALRESLEKDGQTDPGVMTDAGVLVNANTRVVALREIDDPAKRYVRVGVLPATAQQKELALLELRLQMQRDLKVDYSLTNELLFIEELSNKRGISDAQIARELRINLESEKKGAAEVATRLRMLDLIRQMQKIPAEPLPLTFFDRVSYQHLKELERGYQARLQQDAAKADRYLQSFLVSIAAGVTAVHQVRRVDEDFMDEYMLPQLQEDEGVGAFIEELVAPGSADGGGRSTGVSRLLGDTDSNGDEEVDMQKLLDVLTQRDKRIELPGQQKVVLKKDDVGDAIKTAMITGIKEKRRDESAEDKMEAPLEALKGAIKQVAKCAESLNRVASDPDYDDKRRKSLEAAFKKLKRTYRELESSLSSAKVI